MQKKIIIVGAGPAGLMAAYQLSKDKRFQVNVFDTNKALARKFLVAGKGGFNLSNAEPIPEFVQKYNHPFVSDAVLEFPNSATIEWLQELGIETFIGSSGKIFPKQGVKPIEVLNAWIDKLKEQGVLFHYEHSFYQFKNNHISFKTPTNDSHFTYDYLLFALGGASWSVTGSTGSWLPIFHQKGITTIPFSSSNAGIELLNWTTELGGGILKNTAVSIGEQTKFGEIELTQYGLEGAPIYALNHLVRKGAKTLTLDLKPTKTVDELQQALALYQGNKTAFLKSIKLSKSAIHLLKTVLTKEAFMDDLKFIEGIKTLELSIQTLRPIEEAISTVGGISMNEINHTFELKQLKNHFCLGEMLDWDSPTGGYLLQACFAIGTKAARTIMHP
ncbi:MAG: TIGR03862 family flavoprotein [Crocinitomicaceae bacterium]|nr:TIGR03862 family flavoprotein [Crocinitomicaceae bacterium]